MSSYVLELETALRAVLADIEDYERINNLSPSPGKPDCWQSVTHAKKVLASAREREPSRVRLWAQMLTRKGLGHGTSSAPGRKKAGLADPQP